MLTIETIEIAKLDSVTGGVRPGPNGEGCTQGPFPRPLPRPRPNPLDGLGNGIGGTLGAAQ